MFQAIQNHPFVGAQRLIGILLIGFSTTQLVPVLVSLVYQDGGLSAFLLAFLFNFAAGLLLWFPVRRHKAKQLRLRDGTIVVVTLWLVLGLFGAIPLLLTERPWMTYPQAFFETISGLTTTGATVISGLGALPHAVLWYRTQLQFLGGMGIIVLAVAVLPLLGVGGTQLFNAEVPGPMKEDKLTPRIKEAAKALWLTYTGLAAVCALSYWLAGMNGFDAITQAFSTVATGGFANHDASLGYYHSVPILAISMFFMWLGGANFALHFGMLRGRNPLIYIRDLEFRNYTIILLVASLVGAVALYSYHTYKGFGDALIHSAFQVVSIMTSTGFSSTQFSTWPSFLPTALVLIACVGGCAGSTAGGAKVIRLILLFKQVGRELVCKVHPNVELPVKFGGSLVPARVMDGVWAFFFIYVISFVVFVLILMFMGLSGLTAFAATSFCINNTGPGLGSVAQNYSTLGSGPLWVLSFAMLWGRLELFTVLLIFTPAFWRG